MLGNLRSKRSLENLLDSLRNNYIECSERRSMQGIALIQPKSFWENLFDTITKMSSMPDSLANSDMHLLALISEVLFEKNCEKSEKTIFCLEKVLTECITIDKTYQCDFAGKVSSCMDEDHLL